MLEPPKTEGLWLCRKTQPQLFLISLFRSAASRDAFKAFFEARQIILRRKRAEKITWWGEKGRRRRCSG